MIGRSLLALLPAPLIGMMAIWVVFPGAITKNVLLKVFLGVGAGFGIVSCTYFCWSLVFNPAHKGFLLAELFLFLLFACLLVLRISRWKREDNSMPPVPRLKLVSWVLLLLFLAAVAGWFMGYRYFSFMFPHGTFDAYAIWNLRARMIVRGGADWREAFSPELNWKTHPDYPLLTPANIARAWVLMGTETTRVPIVLSGLFTLSLLGLLFSTIARLRSTGQASLSSLLLLTTPWIPFFSTTQNAEIPLAYFYLAVSVLLILYVHSPQPGFMVLAGLMSGFAAWTKNEGVVFLIAVGLTFAFLSVRRVYGQDMKTMLAPFLLGLLVPLAVLIYFKIQLAPPNDLTANQDLSLIFGKILDVDRYWIIFQSFWDIFYRLQKWNNPVMIACLLYLFLFWDLRGKGRKGIGMIALLIILTFAGYYAIYLITPHPLDWHLKYSADRLAFHLFPMYMLVIFLSAGSPEDVFTKGSSS